MKKLSKIFTSAILVLALVLSASMLFACNKRGSAGQITPDTPREDAKTEFADIVLTSLNSGWSRDLSNEQIASLNTCGSYVTVVYWVDFVSQVLYESSLQTSKLQRINTVLLSDEGKALFADAKTNSDKFLPIVNEIGLTADDVANLAYKTMYSLAQNGDGVLNKCKTKLEEVRLLPQTADARNNLNSSYDYVNTLIASSQNFVQTKDQIISTLADAETGIKGLSHFLFETAMLLENNGTGGFIAALSSGALENAEVSEIAVYAGSVLDSVAQMKSVFTADELNNLESALGMLVNDADWLIKSLSDTLKDSIPFLSNLMMALKGAYLTVDIFPSLCDLIGNAGKCLTEKNGAGVYSNLSDLITSLTNDQYFYEDELTPNAAIVYSRMLLAALGIDYDEPDVQKINDQIVSSKEWARNILNDLWTSGGTDYQKLVVLFYCDLMFNLRANTEIETVIRDIPVYDVMLEAFESNYYRYVGSGGSDGVTVLRNSALKFISYASIKGVSSNDAITREWFDKIYTATKAKLELDLNANINAVRVDLDNFIVDFYDDTVSDLIILAGSDIVPATDSEGMQALVNFIEELNLAGFVSLA